MKSKLYFPLFLVGLLLVNACKKDSPSTTTNQTTPTNPANPTTPTPPSLPSNADVYFAGSIPSSADITVYQACYWKNDTVNILTNTESRAVGILVNNKDLYVAGNLHNGTGELAVVWKNGVQTLLSSNSVTSIATGIAANNNNDILVSGYMRDNKGSLEATYWKNGVANIIEPANDLTTGTQANGITANGTDIYMAGYAFNFQTGDQSAVYWKNGVETTLAGNVSVAYGIAVNGSDVYVVGIANGVATLWKNGVATALEKSADGESEAHVITISGSDVYVAGFVGEVPTVWKNGAKTTLPNTQPMPPQEIGMAVNGSDLYIADGVDSNGDSIFWIDGKSAPLIKGLSTVNSVIYVPH